MSITARRHCPPGSAQTPQQGHPTSADGDEGDVARVQLTQPGVVRDTGVQLHEYETMLFADPDAFAYSFENCRAAIQQLHAIADSLGSIELIDDGNDTAPSKRIISFIPEYDGRKSTAGPDTAEYIGVSVIRGKCPHFDQWLKRLEELFWEEK